MKNHLKRIASPRTWIINRKQNKFIVRPYPGAHSFEFGLPLGIILRDVLKFAASMSEVKKILNNEEVLVDGKKRKDHHFIVGLFDVLSFPKQKLHYRVLLDKKGRIIIVEIQESESKIKPCKVVGKTMLPKGKIQFNLHDGKNIISDQKANVGDSLILSLPSLKVEQVLVLQPGAIVFLQKGKHNGDVGALKEINGKEALYEKEGATIETAKNYLFVIGDKKQIIEIKN